MKKINILAVLCLVVGTFAQASLQEKLTAKSEKINVAKQNVRAGKPVKANDGCRTQGCSRCGNKCNKV